MASINSRQSRKAIKGTEYKQLKINETGDNSEAIHGKTTEQEDLSSTDITYSELRNLPVYSDKAATTLGLMHQKVYLGRKWLNNRHKFCRRGEACSQKYSSRVSRTGQQPVVQQERSACGPQGDAQHLYNVFEDPHSLASAKDLPHPSELFGKGKRKGIKRKEQPNSVQFHISQLRTKRIRMKEEIDVFKKNKTFNKPQHDEDTSHETDKEDSRQNNQFVYDVFEVEPHFLNKKPKRRRREE